MTIDPEDIDPEDEADGPADSELAAAARAGDRAAFEGLARQRAYVARGSLYLCNTVAE